VKGCYFCVSAFRQVVQKHMFGEVEKIKYFLKTQLTQGTPYRACASESESEAILLAEDSVTSLGQHVRKPLQCKQMQEFVSFFTEGRALFARQSEA